MYNQGQVTRRTCIENVPGRRNRMFTDREAEDGRECWKNRGKSNRASLHEPDTHLERTREQRGKNPHVIHMPRFKIFIDLYKVLN